MFIISIFIYIILFFNSITNTADITNEYDPNDIKSNKGVSVLAYFGLLFLVPLLAAKDSKFARFHTNQGIVLFILSIAFSLVENITFPPLNKEIVKVVVVPKKLVNIVVK